MNEHDSAIASAATTAAQEVLLGYLLGKHFEPWLPEQREAFLDIMVNIPDLTQGGPLPDIGVIDDLAGLTLAYRDAMARIVNTAIARAQRAQGR